MKNFLPFGRHSKVTLQRLFDPYRPVRKATRLSDLTTGGYIRAHLQDAFVFIDPRDLPASVGNIPYPFRIRFGIAGRPYFTEHFYDAKVFEDGCYPTSPVWKWRYPYRIHVGERIMARLYTAYNVTEPPGERWPVGGVMLSGVRVKDGVPAMLYGVREAARDDIAIPGVAPPSTYEQGMRDIQLRCHEDSDIDLYSVTTNLFESSPDAFWPRKVHLRDGYDRDFWPDDETSAYIQTATTPITLGDDFVLGPDETLTFEIQPTHLAENDGKGNAVEIDAHVLIRGQMEVDDGR